MDRTLIYTLLSSFKCCTGREEKKLDGCILLLENCVLSLFRMCLLWPRNGWVYILLYLQVNFIPVFNYSFFVIIASRFLCNGYCNSLQSVNR